MDSRPYYIGKDGIIIEYEDISSHIGIAKRYVESDPRLKQEFERSGFDLPTDFLIEAKGMIQVTNESGNGWYNNKIVFSASKMDPKQKQMVMGFIAEGYGYDNVDERSKYRADQGLAKRFHDYDDI